MGRYGTQPSVKIGGAYIEGEPGSDEKAARYSAFCDGMCAGTRARWDAGGATEREQKLLDHVHETWRRLGIEPYGRARGRMGLRGGARARTGGGRGAIAYRVKRVRPVMATKYVVVWNRPFGEDPYPLQTTLYADSAVDAAILTARTVPDPIEVSGYSSSIGTPRRWSRALDPGLRKASRTYPTQMRRSGLSPSPSRGPVWYSEREAVD